MKLIGTLLGLVLFAGFTVSTTAADLKLNVVEKEPPKEASNALKELLQPKAIQVLEGEKALYEFWFRSETPVKSKPESDSKALDAIDEITFLGVAQVGEGQRDYKDNEIIPGPYTMRFSLQPQDGDHLGTAEYPYFLVLIPAKNDTALDSIKTYRAMVKTSAKATAGGHPIVLSLRPAEGTEAPTLTSPVADHQVVTVKLPVKAPDAEKPGSIVFALVVEGRTSH